MRGLVARLVQRKPVSLASGTNPGFALAAIQATGRTATGKTALRESGYEAKMASNPSDLDHALFLRRAFDVARRARAGGDHPFGAVLVGPDGQVLMEQGNGYSAEGRDMKAHGERLLASRAESLSPRLPGGLHALRLGRNPARCVPARSIGPESAASSTTRAT